MHPILSRCSVLIRVPNICRSLTTSNWVPAVPRYFENLQLGVSSPTGENGRKNSWEEKAFFPVNATRNLRLAPNLNIPASLPVFSMQHLDFEQLCSIGPAPLPSGQYPFKIPPRIGNSGNQKLPSIWRIEKCDPVLENLQEIHAPTLEHLKIEKLAARLIRIRRTKMNKHQYKKLKKRMGRTWAKYRQRRKMRRLKIFYASQNTIIEKAKAFDPEIYVRNYIQMAKTCQTTEKMTQNSVRVNWKKKFGPDF